MSKAMQAVGELAGAVGMGALEMAEAATGVGVALIPLEMHAMEGLLLAGVASAAGAVAQAIGSNSGMGVTTRQPAAARQIIRGIQRLGGTIVYESTTGSSRRQYNLVIVLATHPCEAIEALYLDGRQVYWAQGSAYNQTVNGYNFGGSAGGGTKVGPNGVHYNFDGLVFCAAFQGKQTSAPTVVAGAWVGPATITDATASYPGFCSALQANDGTWSPASQPSAGTASGSASTGLHGVIDSIAVDSPGFGYADGTVTVVITDPGGAGSGAAAHAIASGGRITSIVVDNGGGNYQNPQVTINPPSSSTVTPYLAGCTYVYLKIEADSGMFPQFPEIKFTVHGKNDIWDPRTSTRGYTSNWALQVADMISDPAWGLGDNSVNQAQLIAAANVCDELVSCQAGKEAQWSLHCHYNTAMGPGDAIQRSMSVAGGRLTRSGGEWYIWPAYWQGPSASFDEGALIEPFQWNPRRQPGQLVNRVTGKYTAPNYPYNVAGDLYDSNGYWQGQTQNNFPFGFQPTDFPMYAADALHGYGEDVYLLADTPNLGAYNAANAYNAGDVTIYNSALWQANEAVPAGKNPGTTDGSGNPYWSATGVFLPQDADMTWCLSVSQAQRAAKVLMMRNRQQGSGSLTMNLSGWALMPADVIEFSSATLGWTNKQLEIAADEGAAIELQTRMIDGGGGDGSGAPALTVALRVIETDASVYEWASTEELTPYDVPVLGGAVEAYTVAAPTGLAAESDLSTALVQPNGTVIPRISLTWTEPADTYVTNGGLILVQMCAHGSAAWQTQHTVDGQTTQVFLGNIVAGSSYDVRILAQRSNGAQSAWTELDNIVAGMALSAVEAEVAPDGTLFATALSDGTANIAVAPFTAKVGSASASCTPNPSSLTGLAQGAYYYVYYIDANFLGGTITPIATQNSGDFYAKPGYYLIGAVKTPTYVVQYRPSTFNDTGQIQSTGESNLFTAGGGSAQVAAIADGTSWHGNGSCTWSGFAKVTPASGTTLHVTADLSSNVGAAAAPYWPATIVASVNGVQTTLVTLNASAPSTDYTLAIASGVDLSTITVTVAVTEGSLPTDGSQWIDRWNVSAMYIQ